MSIIEECETAIAAAVVDALLGGGFSLGLDNGGDAPEFQGWTDRAKILGELRASDEDRLLARKPGTNGWVRLIYGNAQDLISDYTVNLESVMAGPNKLADKWGKRLEGVR